MARGKFGLVSILVGAATFVIALKRQSHDHRRSPSALGPSQVRKPALGRGATSPAEIIPARGWWQIAKRTAQGFSDNELMSEAASVTFFALLSVFPAIAAVVSVYGLFADPATIGEHLDVVGGLIPSGGMDIVREQVKRFERRRDLRPLGGSVER